jgi:hypothetical protein
VSSSGPFCNQTEPLVHTLLLPKEGRVNPGLHGECNASILAEEQYPPVTSSYPLNTKVSPEIRERRKSRRDDSPGLEGSNLDPNTKIPKRKESRSRKRRRYIGERIFNEEKRSVFTPREHGHVSPEEQEFNITGQAFNDADCVRILLERDWILDDPHNNKGLKFVTEFLSYHKSEDCAKLILHSFEGNTLKAYKAGWSVFIDFLLSCEWDDLDLFNSEEHVQELYDNFVSFLMNERNNVPYHATLQYKSTVASFLNTAYNIHVADNVSQKLTVRGFKKRNLKAPTKRAIWDAAVLLNYYRKPSLFDRDNKAQNCFLQTTAIVLIMFFCLTRIQETALLRVDGMIENANAIWLHTIVKLN